MTALTRTEALALDAADTLAPLRELFQLAPLTWAQAGEVVVGAGVALGGLEALKAIRALGAPRARPRGWRQAAALGGFLTLPCSDGRRLGIYRHVPQQL